jgi:hypothetical protein
VLSGITVPSSKLRMVEVGRSNWKTVDHLVLSENAAGPQPELHAASLRPSRGVTSSQHAAFGTQSLQGLADWYRNVRGHRLRRREGSGIDDIARDMGCPWVVVGAADLAV